MKFHGKKNKICSHQLADQLNDGTENSQLNAFDNSSHCLFLEESKKFNSEMIKFAMQ